jgi:hypothetical protein
MNLCLTVTFRAPDTGNENNLSMIVPVLNVGKVRCNSRRSHHQPPNSHIHLCPRNCFLHCCSFRSRFRQTPADTTQDSIDVQHVMDAYHEAVVTHDGQRLASLFIPEGST